MAEKRLREIRNIRLQRAEKLRELGIDPYPSKVGGDPQSIKKARESEGEDVEVAGRIMGWRGHGNVSFADLKDEAGQVQLWFQKNNLGDNFKILKYLDIGDFVYIKGKVVKTKAGELSIDVEEFQLLTKSIRPLPSKWYGFKDEEARYRQRYVDLILNDDLKNLFKRKAIFWQSMRNFMIEKGFLEVETPVLENTAGGADASPFITHHEALDTDLYLRISMGELWQKRLMVGGFEKTFEIGRQFRNEGISREHLQDYSQMEFYWAYANYEDSMKLVEKMYKNVAEKTFGKMQFKIGKFDIDLNGTWKKIDYTETIKNNLGIDISTTSEDEIKAKLKTLDVKFGEKDSKERLIDLLWKQVRKGIAGPAFLVGHPVEVSPLAKRQKDRPKFVERYQIILAGSEMGNGYSELNDPVDQAERFKAQQKMRDEGDEEAQMHDEDFVRALEYGMPPTTGFGVSERLFSFLADLPIREAVLFPLLKPESVGGKRKSKSDNAKKADHTFSISQEIKDKFPGTTFAYTLIKGVSIKKKDDELEKLKREVFESRQGLTIDQVRELRSVKTYREMLKSTGIKVGSRMPSPEALLKRIVNGKGIYNINTAVDAYNLAVVETGVGLGGFDYNYIVTPVTLRFSQEGEEMMLLGDSAPTKTKEGEIVYSDNDKLLTLDLNYRDIDETKITLKTKNIILFADGGSGIDKDEVLEALRKGAENIKTFCGGEIGELKLIV